MGRNRGRGAHPRVCGENARRAARQCVHGGSSPRVRGKRFIVCFPFGSWGSSPRVRGKPNAIVALNSARGLIPACAGKTRRRAASHSAPTAHPRVCGENQNRENFLRCHRGSSPRVRGKRDEDSFSGSAAGLIPACAGKTFVQGISGCIQEAHPRVCGENERFSCPGEYS